MACIIVLYTHLTQWYTPKELIIMDINNINNKSTSVPDPVTSSLEVVSPETSATMYTEKACINIIH